MSTLVQYNSSTSSWSSNVRVRWEYSPGSELFVVYSDGRNTDVKWFPQLQSRVLAAKITYLLWF